MANSFDGPISVVVVPLTWLEVVAKLPQKDTGAAAVGVVVSDVRAGRPIIKDVPAPA